MSRIMGTMLLSLIVPCTAIAVIVVVEWIRKAPQEEQFHPEAPVGDARMLRITGKKR
jgi:hypothetical protein